MLTKFEKYMWVTIASACTLASVVLTIFYAVQELFVETFCVGCAAVVVAATIVITAVKMPIIRVNVKNE